MNSEQSIELVKLVLNLWEPHKPLNEPQLECLGASYRATGIDFDEAVEAVTRCRITGTNFRPTPRELMEHATYKRFDGLPVWGCWRTIDDEVDYTGKRNRLHKFDVRPTHWDVYCGDFVFNELQYMIPLPPGRWAHPDKATPDQLSVNVQRETGRPESDPTCGTNIYFVEDSRTHYAMVYALKDDITLELGYEIYDELARQRLEWKRLEENQLEA
jgi:hypothetical protein